MALLETMMQLRRRSLILSLPRLTISHMTCQVLPGLVPESITQQEVSGDTAGPALSELFMLLPTPSDTVVRPPETPTSGVSAVKADSSKESASPPTTKRLGDPRCPQAWQCGNECFMKSSGGPRQL